MNRVRLAALVAVTTSIAAYSAVGLAGHPSSGELHSPNMTRIANFSDGGKYRNGTDMAFWGDTALLGNLDQGVGPNASPPGGFRIMDIKDPASPRQIGRHICSGDQSDVSIWRSLVITSVDKPTFANCKDGDNTWEGLRILSIADPENPRILGTVRTDCGSHTHTIHPEPSKNRLIVYVLSYPLAGRYNPTTSFPSCSAASHRKISVVEVPLANPEDARVLSTPSVETTIGCHDVTLFLEDELAAAACLTETQIWDISKPAEPQIVSRIRDPRMNLSHSTAFSNDGKTLVIGDELGGAAASPGCLSDKDTHGGLFFYDVSDPAAPKPVGTFKLPQQRVSLFCTAHQFNVVPRRDEHDVLVTSWYTGATSVIDFTDPSKPEQIAYYIPRDPVSPDEQPREAATWASYFYGGVIYSNNFDEDVNSVLPRSRGLDVFRVDHPRLNEGTVPLTRLNPQVQEPLPPPQ